MRLKSEDHDAHGDLGSVLFDNGDPDGAIAECQEALRLDPDDYGAHVVLGAAFCEKGDEEAALGQFREADRLTKKRNLHDRYVPDQTETDCNSRSPLRLRGTSKAPIRRDWSR